MRRKEPNRDDEAREADDTFLDVRQEWRAAGGSPICGKSRAISTGTVTGRATGRSRGGPLRCLASSSAAKTCQRAKARLRPASARHRGPASGKLSWPGEYRPAMAVSGVPNRSSA